MVSELQEQNIDIDFYLIATVLFFGSARAKSTTQYKTAMADLEVTPSMMAFLTT